MELLELTKKTLEMFEIESVDDLPKAIEKCVVENDVEKYSEFENLTQDLKIDWLQKIFQYYLADRKEKMQDYTPVSLARLIGVLAKNKSDEVIDMCAGSGALTIQAWNENPNSKFCCQEFDEKVIPILLFNLAIRNIDAEVIHTDVLQKEIFGVYRVFPQEKYGKVEKINERHNK